MPKLVIRPTGATMVYSDTFSCIARAIGTLDIQRATDVEFDAARQEWTATLRTTGQVIASGQNRAEVIAQEVKFLEEAQ